MVDEVSNVAPQYPLYLDVPMMITFLAALEDGVSFEKNVLRRVRGLSGTESEGHGKVGGTALTGLIGLDIGGSRTGNSEAEELEELQHVRWHTEASLFNQLRELLFSRELVHSVGRDFAQDSQVAPGDVVEVNGVVLANPLDELEGMVSRLRPFVQTSSTRNGESVEMVTRHERSRARKAGVTQVDEEATKSSTVASRSSDVFVLMESIRDDLKSSTMSDLLLASDSESFPRIVLTVKSDFGTEIGSDGLVGAQVAVIGKVTSVSAEGDTIDMLRRSILNFMPKEQLKDMFDTLTPLFGQHNLVDRLVVPAPFMQIMPLAIFI